MKFVAPALNKRAFTCPVCDVLAKQEWRAVGGFGYDLQMPPSSTGRPQFSGSTMSGYVIEGLFVSTCQHCGILHVWSGNRMVDPISESASLVNPDTPENIALDYNEARAIVAQSPRAAAALLRLAIQKLCAHLGEPGENINADIASLVKKGLDTRIQKALDILRVVGNESVHPGSIDLNDEPDTAQSLFHFFNLIVERMITEPQHIEAMYAKLPAGKLKGIEQRDKK